MREVAGRVLSQMGLGVWPVQESQLRQPDGVRALWCSEAFSFAVLRRWQRRHGLVVRLPEPRTAHERVLQEVRLAVQLREPQLRSEAGALECGRVGVWVFVCQTLARVCMCG